jgi:uncharacterized repeat protein (TIGR03803 family)
VAALLLDGTTLYGTTYVGGSSGYGTVFKLSTDGSSYSVLKHFSSYDYPRGSLVLAGATLYGTIQSGGSLNFGSVFSIRTNGSDYTVLGSFMSDGYEGVIPRAGLVLWGNTLYGTASGGAGGYGTVFKINTNGSGFTPLKNFSKTDAIKPYGGLAWAHGTLYGTTSTDSITGGGAVFSVYLAPELTLTNTGGHWAASWSAAPGLGFQLQYKTSLAQSDWINLGSRIVATNSTVTVSDADCGDPQRFYRVVEQ